jgi:hypothetical protein
MRRIISVCFLLLLLTSVVYAASAKERRFVFVGMSEGEVLEKVGKPDYESIDTGANVAETVKRWVYFPAKDDPETITTIVLRQGKVIQVTREISR